MTGSRVFPNSLGKFLWSYDVIKAQGVQDKNLVSLSVILILCLGQCHVLWVHKCLK